MPLRAEPNTTRPGITIAVSISRFGESVKSFFGCDFGGAGVGFVFLHILFMVLWHWHSVR
jgi:hypothetical protein